MVGFFCFRFQLAPPGHLLVGRELQVRIVDKPDWPVLASYSRDAGVLTFNEGTLDPRFFDERSWEGLQRINELVIHEFAHEYAPDHFTTKFHDSMGLIGARMVNLAIRSPELILMMVSEEQRDEEGFWPAHHSRCA